MERRLQNEINTVSGAQVMAMGILAQMQQLNSQAEQNNAEVTYRPRTVLAAQERVEHLERTLRQCQHRREFLRNSNGIAGLETSSCPICMESPTDVITPCGHAFCAHCLSRSLQTARQCAMCRTAINPREVMRVQTATETDLRGTKLKRMFEDLHNIVGNKRESCVVFVQWTTLLKAIATLMKNDNLPYMVLRGNSSARKSTLQRFTEADDPNILLLSLENSNAGLSLCTANHVFFPHALVSQTITDAALLYMQAIGRVHRLGQNRPVVVHQYLSEDTREEEIFSEQVSICQKLQNFKEALTTAVSEQEATSVES